MSEIITAQDVYDRYYQAVADCKAYVPDVDNLPDDYNHARHKQLVVAVNSWFVVAERVSYGGNPLICVMERE